MEANIILLYFFNATNIISLGFLPFHFVCYFFQVVLKENIVLTLFRDEVRIAVYDFAVKECSQMK